MCSITIIYLPTSSTYGCYTTLGNIGCSWEGLATQSYLWMHKTDALSLSGGTSLIFVNPGTKIDGCYYRDVALMQQVLPSIRSIAGDAYIFQRDSALMHRIRQTVELLQHETPKFIAPDLWPPNSPDLNLTDYRI